MRLPNLPNSSALMALDYYGLSIWPRPSWHYTAQSRSRMWIQKPSHRSRRSAQWKYDKSQFNIQGAALEVLQSLWLSSVFPHLLKPMKVGRSLHTRTLVHMVTTLNAQLAVFKQEDFDWFNRELRNPYKALYDMPSFLVQKHEYLLDLAEACQPVNNMDAVALLQLLYPPRAYQLCWQEC